MRRTLHSDARQRDKSSLDRLAAAKVKARDGYRCRIPGCYSGSGVDWAHLFSKRYQNTRWDLDNAWTLCRVHHIRYTLNPTAWTELLIATLGREAYDALQAKALAIVHPDYAAVRISLEAA